MKEGKLAETKSAVDICQLVMALEKLKSVYRWRQLVCNSDPSNHAADLLVSTISLFGCAGEVGVELEGLIREGRIRRDMVPDSEEELDGEVGSMRDFWDECFINSQSKSGDTVVKFEGTFSKLLIETRSNFDAHHNPAKGRKHIIRFLKAMDDGKVDSDFIESESGKILETRYIWGQRVFEYFLSVWQNNGKIRDEAELRDLLQKTTSQVKKLMGLTIHLIGHLIENPNFVFEEVRKTDCRP